MKETSNFKVEADNHIAWLILNRPEKRNAMGLAFFEEIGALFDDFERNPDIRVGVIRAEGKSFSAGTDLEEAAALVSQRTADGRDKMQKDILKLQQGFTKIERCRKPVIAAIHSHCVGGGMDMICACDMRLATKDAIFSIRETRLGIVADLGTLQRLPHIIGQGRFRELALTGRDFTAQEALQMGLVTRICDDRPTLYKAAKNLADEIAACPPLTVQGTKEVINYSRDNGIEAGLQYVAQKNSAALPSEDLFEAVTAFMEKRKPVFKGK
ncbi:MAG: crotonase/enoyl-CoA hydratase family protein [Desulfobacterales bacterium]|nr:crotonase/enoyl-CoA hydratase family protein [Desulfobacterales bacterium]